MYVEQAIWTVPADKCRTSLSALNAIAPEMHSSGGMIRLFTGEDVESPECLLGLSFWKCWEDLSRFMGSSKNTLMSESSKMLLHQFEIVWEWPDEEVNTVYGDTYWALHDFTVDDNQVQELLSVLRQKSPGLRAHNGFRSAAIWIDKHTRGHIVFAVQSSGVFVDILKDTADQFPGEHSRRIARLRAVSHLNPIPG